VPLQVLVNDFDHGGGGRLGVGLGVAFDNALMRRQHYLAVVSRNCRPRSLSGRHRLSASRIAQNVWRPKQRGLICRLRAMARFEDTRDLRLMGGYQPDHDADLDNAFLLALRIFDLFGIVWTIRRVSIRFANSTK
jgi:hypothetical protein